jgi:DNA primase
LPFGVHSDQDRNPTASINYKKLVYNCFGCGAGGSIFWFVGLMRDSSSEEARKWVGQKASIGDGTEGVARLLEFFDELYRPEGRINEPMPRMDPKVLDPWMFIHPYMTEVRGVSEEVLIRQKVGYGVIRVRLSETEYVNSHRIVVPHFWKGELVGWQTRRIIKDETPKWKSSPDFPKDRTLYNYSESQPEAVIVESPMSVLSKMESGPHIEATFGSYVTDLQFRLISMHPRVTLFMDNDDSGFKATARIGTALAQKSIVRVASNPWSADAADLDDDTYRKCLDEAVPFSLWKVPSDLGEWKVEEQVASG